MEWRIWRRGRRGDLETVARKGGPELRLTRRQILWRSTVFLGGVTVAALLARIAWLVREDPAPDRHVLSNRDVTTLTAVVEAALPGGNGMPPGDANFITNYLDRFLVDSDPDMRLVFRGTLYAIETEPKFTRWTRFSRLSLAERFSELRAWEMSPTYLVRTAFSSLKILIGAAYFEQPRVLDAMGWYVGCSVPHLGHKSRDRFFLGNT